MMKRKMGAGGLKGFRESNGISLLKISEVSALSRNTLKKLESGKSVRTETVFKLLRALVREYGTNAIEVVDVDDLPNSYMASAGVIDDQDVNEAAALAVKYLQFLVAREDNILRRLDRNLLLGILDATNSLQFRHRNAVKRNRPGYVE